MSNKYEVLVDDDTYELFREAMSHTLKGRGFKEGLQVTGMDSPSVAEFHKDEDAVTLQATVVGGGDFRVVVESETLDVDRLVLDIVENTVLHLVSLLARTLDEPARDSLVRDLRELLRSIPPGEEK